MKFFIVACLISVAAAVPALPLLADHDGYGYGHAAPLAYAHGYQAVAGPALHAAPLAYAGHGYGHAPAGLGGNGFGHGGHFSPMPVQEVKYVPVPHPVPVAQPYPVDKPYAVPVDKPYTVPVDRPVPAPYVAKVVQPVIHKQTVVSSAVHTVHGHK